MTACCRPTSCTSHDQAPLNMAAEFMALYKLHCIETLAYSLSLQEAQLTAEIVRI